MNTDRKHTDPEDTATNLPMPPAAFLQWGVGVVAYVKPFVSDGGIAFAIHRADGERMGITANADVAYAAIIQNDLEPMRLH